MSKKYRMKSLAGPFLPGTIVTEEQVKAAGGDLEFWKSHGAAVEATDADVAAADAPKNDEGVKAEIERRIREETVKRGPLSVEDQSAVVAEVTGKNAEALAQRDENPRVAGKPAPPPAKSKSHE